MSLRRKITQYVLNNHPIPLELQNPEHEFYYNDYVNNLYCPMGNDALRAYNEGNGCETMSQKTTIKGKTYIRPAKMASIASSSALTFNLLGNNPVKILPDNILPSGTYNITYEKRMHSLALRSAVAHLDAFLSDKENKTAIFCEMKMLEWLDKPRTISETYFSHKYYFEEDTLAVNFPEDAYGFFTKWAQLLRNENFIRYDVWQMFKHILAIYNYSSFVTKKSLNNYKPQSSIAGEYDRIILANVVNEFPAELIKDEKTKLEYERALYEEQSEARVFIETMSYCQIPRIFDNNCNSGIQIEYLSAKQFAEMIEMSESKRTYLKRYYE